MADLPIMPLKTDALLADTGHLSAEEFGAYCRILFTMWRHEARLADDPIELARIAGVTTKQWSKISERVMRPMTVAAGIVSQKRLSATWLDVQELRKKRASAADKRWRSKSNANASAEHVPSIVICNANQISKKESTFLSESAASLATAPHKGALRSPPSAEQAEKKRLGEKEGRKLVASPELEAIMRSKRA